MTQEAQSLEDTTSKCVSTVTQNDGILGHLIVHEEAFHKIVTLLNERPCLACLFPDVDNATQVDVVTIGLALKMFVHFRAARRAFAVRAEGAIVRKKDRGGAVSAIGPDAGDNAVGVAGNWAVYLGLRGATGRKCPLE